MVISSDLLSHQTQPCTVRATSTFPYLLLLLIECQLVIYRSVEGSWWLKLIGPVLLQIVPWRWSESNRWPDACKAYILPSELHPLCALAYTHCWWFAHKVLIFSSLLLLCIAHLWIADLWSASPQPSNSNAKFPSTPHQSWAQAMISSSKIGYSRNTLWWICSWRWRDSNPWYKQSCTC